MTKSNTVKQVVKFPSRVLRPIREYLNGLQKKLEKRKKDLGKEDPFSDASRVNENAASDTDAYEISGHDRVEALRNEVDRRLISVKKALTKIKLGKYGLCDNCGNMIDTDRLSVDPAAEYCIECEQKKKSKL